MMTQRLLPWSFFAAMLAAAGLPIYIHAPKFYADEYGVGLAALGAVLFGLRLFDVVQDPVLGWLSDRLRPKRAIAVAIAALAMVAGMLGLFAVTPPIAPLLWFAVMLTLLFSAYSFLNITFYAEGVSKAGQVPGGHVQLAGWRETGALLGVSFAAVAPALLVGARDPFAGFALGFAVFSALAVLMMRHEWGRALAPQTVGLRNVLADATARRLLLIALLNATPLAVTSTLFLFFVESRLDAPGWEGPLLVLFFLSAAVSAPFWSHYAAKTNIKRVLLIGMALAVLSFVFAAFLSAGDVLPFALICVASGAALGADMTLLPAIFAARMARIAPSASAGFGLWSFVTKFALAFAAVVLLPLLESSGFRSEGPNSPEALQMLSGLYALVPVVLKLAAMMLLIVTPIKDA